MPLWKEIQDIEHIKEAVPDGCKCSLCQAARSVADSVSPEEAASAKNAKTPELQDSLGLSEVRRPFPVLHRQYRCN